MIGLIRVCKSVITFASVAASSFRFSKGARASGTAKLPFVSWCTDCCTDKRTLRSNWVTYAQWRRAQAVWEARGDNAYGKAPYSITFWVCLATNLQYISKWSPRSYVLLGFVLAKIFVIGSIVKRTRGTHIVEGGVSSDPTALLHIQQVCSIRISKLWS